MKSNLIKLVSVSFAFLCFIPLSGRASDDSLAYAFDQKKLTDRMDIFFNKFKQEGALALDDLFSSQSIINKNDSQVILLKDKLNLRLNSMGKFCREELITLKLVSNSMVLLSYLIIYEGDILRFTFIFFKPHELWVLYKFTFDDNIVSEFEDAGKIYFLTK